MADRTLHRRLALRLGALLVAGALLAPPVAAAAAPVKLTNLPVSLKYAPAWSFQGDRLAYVVADGVYVVNRDGTGMKRLYACAAGVTVGPPAFTADGAHVAFAVGGAIRAVSSFTGAAVADPAFPAGCDLPAFSRDGRHAVALHRDGAGCRGFLLDLPTATTRELPGVAPVAARFSADGRHLFFLDGADYQSVRRVDLAASLPVAETLFDLRGVEGLGDTLVAYDLAVSDRMLGVLTNAPAYSPYSLFTMDLDGAGIRHQASDVKEFDLASDGTLAYISHTDFSLETLDTQNGSYLNIDWGKAMYLRFAPEEDGLAYVKFTSTSRQLWFYTIETPAAPAAPAAPAILAAGVDWIDVAVPAEGASWFRVHVDGAPVGAAACGSGIFRITGLSAATPYAIQLSALAFGLESPLSPAASAVTAGGAPAAPASVTPFAVGPEGFSIRIACDGPAGTFLIALDGGEPVESASAEHTFAGLAASTAYRVDVRCVAGGLVSEPVELAVSTTAYPPFAPDVTWPVAEGALLASCPPLVVGVEAPYLAGFSVTLDGAPLAPGALAGEGDHALALVATDRGGVVHEAFRAFSIDATAPGILFVNFADGDLKTPPFAPEIVVVEPHPGPVTVTLNGHVADPANLLLAEGEHELAVSAVDAAGNAASRSARLTVARPALTLGSFTLHAASVEAGTGSVGAAAAFALAGAEATLALAVCRDGVPVGGSAFALAADLVAWEGALPLVDAAGEALPAGDYLVAATLHSADGRSAGPLTAPLAIADRPAADLLAEGGRLDRALLHAGPHGDAEAEAAFAALGLPCETVPRNRSLAAIAAAGRHGIYAVKAQRLNAFAYDALLPRVRSGDLLLVYGRSHGRRGFMKDKDCKRNVAGVVEIGAGLVVRIDLLAPESLDAALERWNACPAVEPRFGKSRKVRVAFRRDGNPFAAAVAVDAVNVAACGPDGTPLAPGATLPVPEGGTWLYLDRDDDLSPAAVDLASADGLSGTIGWPPLEPLALEAARLADALDAAHPRSAAGRLLVRKAALLARSLVSTCEADPVRARLALAAVRAIRAALAVVAKLEGATPPDADLPLLALELRLEKLLGDTMK